MLCFNLYFTLSDKNHQHFFFLLFSYSVLVCNLGWNKMLVVPHVVVVSVYIVTVVSMCMLMRYELMNQKIIKGQAIITFFISMVRFLFEFDFFCAFLSNIRKNRNFEQKWQTSKVTFGQYWQMSKVTYVNNVRVWKFQ